MVRFRPRLVYSRCCTRGTPTNCSRSRRMTDGLHQQQPGQTSVCHTSTPEVHDDASQSTTHNVAAVSQFLMGISQPLPQPILQGPMRQPSPPQRRKRPPVPARRSVRIAAKIWPRGDTQAKARQVLMKRLGILDVQGLNHDEAMLRYFNLFKGPLDDDTVKALTALCGLDAAVTLPTTFA